MVHNKKKGNLMLKIPWQQAVKYKNMISNQYFYKQPIIITKKNYEVLILTFWQPCSYARSCYPSLLCHNLNNPETCCAEDNE